MFSRTVNNHADVILHVRKGLTKYLSEVILINFCIEIATEFFAVENKGTTTIIMALYRSCFSDSGIVCDGFETLLAHVINTYKTVIIMGNFNIEFLGNSPQLEKLTCLKLSLVVKDTIHDITRVTSITQICFDNMLNNIGNDSFSTLASRITKINLVTFHENIFSTLN